ncbi:MAG: AAA-like domain-containing protein, partial [Anaerolineae bacterium]|nr:AAA-like domain-containing protein [Anaerolineae bacterium]
LKLTGKTKPQPSPADAPASEISQLSDFEITPPYGTMPPTSKFYVEREADDRCRDYLTQAQAFTLFIQAPRQVGKSSLMLRMVHRAKTKFQRKTVFVDFQKFPEHLLADPENFFIEFCLMIGDALNVPDAIDKFWNSRRTNIIKCSRYITHHVIPKVGDSVILAMDEVERMLVSPFRSDFFGMLRTWHNDRVTDTSFAKLTLMLSSSTEPYLLIDNPNQSPFNIAERVTLRDFTLQEVGTLNDLHGAILTPPEVEALMQLTNGHPFLTRMALFTIAKRAMTFAELQARSISDNGPFGDHLSHFLLKISERPILREALAHICQHQDLDDDTLFHRLKASGLIIRRNKQVVFRNQLYDRYFKERLNV